ncbi:MAG: winged helix-turn-helix domain-containing protein [Candidatus Methanofastidiosia archaeon]
MSRYSEEQKRKLHYSIYEVLYENPRIHLTRLTRRLGRSRNSISRAFREMMDERILITPQLRLRALKNIKEFVYLLKLKDEFKAFEKLRGNEDVIYHTLLVGEYNMLLISRKPLDFSNLEIEKMGLNGVRGDYLDKKVKNLDFDKAFEIITKKIENFNYKKSEIEDGEDRENMWSEDEWRLFSEIKYNYRCNVTETCRRLRFSRWKFYECLGNVERDCLILIDFYPKGYSNYTYFILGLETDYERFIEELISYIPSCSTIFKVDDHLICYINIFSGGKNLVKYLNFIINLKNKKIVKSYWNLMPVAYRYKS